MKNIHLLVFAVLASATLCAQSVQISGDCIDVPTALPKQTTLQNGKNWYRGSVMIGGEPADVAVRWIGAPSNIWVVAWDGQPFFKSSANTSKPPSTSSTVYSWAKTSAYFAICTSPPPLVLEGDVTLGVDFGDLLAQIKNDRLVVNWETLSEIGNDHFNIEASQDGKEFKTIATVKSKAVNGNSETPITYEWHSDIGGSLAAIPFVALLLASFTSLRRNKVVMASILVLTIVAAGFSCSKTEGHLAGSKDGYIRIVQVDKDGTTSQSKVIKISSE